VSELLSQLCEFNLRARKIGLKLCTPDWTRFHLELLLMYDVCCLLAEETRRTEQTAAAAAAAAAAVTSGE